MQLEFFCFCRQWPTAYVQTYRNVTRGSVLIGGNLNELWGRALSNTLYDLETNDDELNTAVLSSPSLSPSSDSESVL